MALKQRRTFSLQWHVTVDCDQNCLHCYLPETSTYESEKNNPLDLHDCRKIIDSLVMFCLKLPAEPRIVFTGGDPLLRDDFFEILDYANSRNVVCSILGNPFHLTPSTIQRLKGKIRGYQISIDGMERIHDSFRRVGSFQASVRGIRDLKMHGVRTVVMFTISKANSSDLVPVMRLANELNVDAFAFARLCGMGNGRNLDIGFTPTEYRNLLHSTYEEEKRLKAAGSKTRFNKKDNLWELLLSELGEKRLTPTGDGLIHSGCSIGANSFCVLADGAALACRRFYSPIGKLPEQSVEEVFLSDELDLYRKARFDECSRCELYQYCRGCPAVAYGVTGRFGAPDPQCWKYKK